MDRLVHSYSLSTQKKVQTSSMPRLPDGWLDSESMGTPVGPFLPIKVPLDAKYDSSFYHHKNRRHDIQQIIRDLEASTTSANASAVFDLTNTNKYYDRDLVTMLGVEHVKFMGVAGHGALPSEGHVRSFIKHTKRVLAKSPDSTIITHCTHGHNRTGYMICSYLIREMRMGAQEAIRLFAEARPPGIYKAFYIDALCYQTGCFDDAALHITYPPETKIHDDETRGMGVFSSGKLDEGCLARQTPAFDYALGNVFPNGSEEAQYVEVTTEATPSLKCEGVVDFWHRMKQFGFVDISCGKWRAVPQQDPNLPPTYEYPCLDQAILRAPEFIALPDPTRVYIPGESVPGSLVKGARISFELKLLSGKPFLCNVTGEVIPHGASQEREGDGQERDGIDRDRGDGEREPYKKKKLRGKRKSRNDDESDRKRQRQY